MRKEDASDGRLKNKLDKKVRGMETIMQLEPTWYTWNEDSPFEIDKPELGLIAQEVELVLPECVIGKDVENLPMNYSDRAIIASLVKHNKELQKEVNVLNAKLNELLLKLKNVFGQYK